MGAGRPSRTTPIALGAVLCGVAAAVLGGAVLADDRSEPVAAGSTPVTVDPAASAPTTTSSAVVPTVLAAGIRETATVRPSVRSVQVRTTPPPGWDEVLTPVVRAADLDGDPGRSALDIDRVPLPGAGQPIAGRAVTPTGWSFTNPTAYQPPQPLVFGVVERQGDWVRVQLPVRPNGTTGWVRAADVVIATSTRSVEVSLAQRRLRVTDGARVLMDVPVAIGRADRPTPTGWFTVTDIVPSTDPTGSYGPVALALDGYSEVLDSFPSENGTTAPDADAPVLALHGTDDPASVGRAASNGCPRLYNTDVVELARLAPAGTPVRIWP